MKINTFKKQIEKINNKNIVDQYNSFTSMKRLLDVQIKELKEHIIKTKDPHFNITHIKILYTINIIKLISLLIS